LASWAKLLPWQQVANVFQSSWQSVYRPLLKLGDRDPERQITRAECTICLQNHFDLLAEGFLCWILVAIRNTHVRSIAGCPVPLTVVLAKLMAKMPSGNELPVSGTRA
jgi:hypothetical protein